MTPVFQTKMGEGGNCWQAAVASIFGLDLDDVPDFVQEDDPDDAYSDFLYECGFIAVQLPGNAEPDCYYIAFGPSLVTGRAHAVVARDGYFIHDPHPGRNGLERVEYVHLMVPTEIDLS